MKTFLSIFLFSLLAILPISGFAVSEAGQYYITQMTQGGPVSIRNASNGIIQSGERDTEVLDTLAEVLLQNYSQQSNDYIDAMSWATKALGASGNGRYRDTLEEVIDSKQAHRKLKKWAKKSAKQLDDGAAEQYHKGDVDLAAIRAETEKASQARAAEIADARQSGAYKPITSAVVGMSQDEVMSLCGPPTATTSHMTGKQWKPFNFKGSDTMRTYLLYKGQGRVVMSNDSHYSTSAHVLEVMINPNETGYP